MCYIVYLFPSASVEVVNIYLVVGEQSFYCPMSEAPACSQCKILIMTTTPSSIRWKGNLNFKLMTEYNRSLVSLKAFFVFCFFAFRTVLNLLFPLLQDSSIDPEFSGLVLPQEAIFFANYFPSSHFSSFNNSSFFVVFKSLLSGFVGFLYKVLEGVILIEEQENV